METGSTAGPAAAAGDAGVLTIVDEQFENVLDEPFIIVNWEDGKLLAEIVKSPDKDITWLRIQRAMDVAHGLGQHLWASKDGDYADVGYDVVTLHFMPDGDL
ncbi:MAG TPA: hypothetical protein VF885_02715 [Arthrobacter sp.]